MDPKEMIIKAHKPSFGNYWRLKAKKQKCGCFYCCRIFNSSEISDWIFDVPEYTAICPYCEIDSVIGEEDGYPITEEFLEEMYNYWF